MQGGGDDSPGYGESGIRQLSIFSTVEIEFHPPPNQMWSPQSPPPWQQTAQQRGQSSSHQQRNVGRPQSGFGDYRPNMDAINNPSQQFQSSHFQSSQFQYTQSPLSDYDRFTWEQLMGTPETPTSGSVETGRGGRGGGGDGVGNGNGNGPRRSTYYSKDEFVVVARAWDAVMTDATVGTDQTDVSFWKRVLAVYNGFKLPGTAKHTHGQVQKKFGRIAKALKRFIGIYDNQVRSAESGRSEADIQALSCQLFHTDGWPKFGYWEEFLVLRDCPKFRAICAQEEAPPGAKRTRLGAAGNYSTSSCSLAFDLNDDVSEEPSASLSRRPRPQGQQAAIREARTASQFSAASREARTASQFSAASTSASRPTPTAALAHTLEVQMMKQLQDSLALYEKSTDPVARTMYYDLIMRLRSKLGWAEGSETGDASGSGGGGGGNEGGEEDVSDSDDATE